MSGYSKNPSTAQRLLPLLSSIEAGELCTWETEHGQSDYLAYKIREALYIARLYRDWSQFSQLAKMSERIRIVTTGPSTVEARLAKGTPEALILTGSGTPTSGYENPGRSSVVLTRQTVATIREAWQRQQPSNTPLHFPSADLSYDELVELYGWAEGLGLILFEVDGALTVQRKTLELAKLAWAPSAPSGEDVPEDDFPFKD